MGGSLDFQSLVPKKEGANSPDFSSLVPKGTEAPKTPEKPPEPETQIGRDISDFKETVSNIPGSAVNFGKNLAQPFIDPVGTYESLKNLGKGVLQKTGLMSGNDSEKYADAVGQFLKDRYGSMENIQHTLKTDPIGLAADVSMLLSGGGSAAARLPGIAGKVGEATAAAGRVVDPLSAVGAAARGTGALARHAAGDYLAHTGDRPLAEAFKAGKKGGESGEEFRASMRHPAEQFGETVEEARRAVDQVGKETGRVYRSGMVDIKADKSILDFRDIDAEIARTKEIGKFGEFNKDTPKVDRTRQRMLDKIEEFKWAGWTYGAHKYHTPEGFDALKQALGHIAEETERGSPASKVAWGIYNSVKDTIVKQTPAYAKVMEGYAEGKQVVRELERELTGKPDAPLGPALRKLQSVMRNNVHTAFGQREALAQFLVDNGAEHLMTRLAGQALSTWTPRGFGRAVGSADLVGGIGAALLGHPKVLAMTLLTLPMMSPRILGEAAHFAGRASPYLPGAKTGEAAFQLGRVQEEEARPVPATP